MNSSQINTNQSQSFYSNTKELKIKQLYSKIIQSIKDNLITFISSKTGSGKSTQVPKYLYQHLLKEKKKESFCIICTEPRSIACESIRSYVLNQEKEKDIKIETNTSEYFNKSKQVLLYIKENDLLYLLKKDPYLKFCDILIIDEVHERTMKLELLLYYIKHFTLCDKNKNRIFRLLLMSATLNVDDIHNYFSSINDKKFTFGFINQDDLNDNFREDNYDIYYSNYISNSLYYGNAKFNELNMGKILREICKIVRLEVYSDDYDKKTILIFLPDYKSIYSLSNILDKEYKGYINIYQFISASGFWKQKELLDELKYNNKRKEIICNVIISTTLAETCLTFPNCDVVIDCGLKKICKYNYDSNIFEEVIEYISQDSCIQRSGRCGRGLTRGRCYRLFSEESYNLMDKFRKPEIEIGNIDLIILKLFENEEIIKHVNKEIKEKKYLDFLSKIDKDKYEKIVNKLIKYNAISKNKFNKYEITNFGEWIKKTNMDIELGYYFDKFKNEYPEALKEKEIFQLLNIITTTDNYNNELFYADIDPDKFKLNLLDYKKEQNKKLVDIAENVSKNIINQALIKYKSNQSNFKNFNEENKEEERVNKYMDILNHISPYYSLFSKLDEIYSGKNFYTKNKIFQLGDWIITFFFINQYNMIKCLRHFYFEEKESEVENCDKCELEKHFYCDIYSLNEKYFVTHKNRAKHNKNALNIEFAKDNSLKKCKNEELILIKWNIIYLNLISNKPDKYITENQIIKYLNEFKKLDFAKIMNTLYDEYKKLYINVSTKYLNLTKNDDEMLIQKKIFETNTNEEENNKIVLYFNKNGKANILKSYFFEFMPNNIDKYFSLTKFRKILGNSDKKDDGGKEIKFSKLYYKDINPIFNEILNESTKINNHFESLTKDIIEQKEIKIYNNIGKFFYFHFISPKLDDKKIEKEKYHNSIVYLYSKDSKDIEKNDKTITELINNERENYYNMLDSIQCLKGGCLTIQLTQGLEVKSIYDTYQNTDNKNELFYVAKFKNDPKEKKDINYYYQKITENKDLKHKKLLILKDKLIVVFIDSLQFALFSEKQNLDIKLIPYKENIEITSEEINENNYNSMKIFIIRFELKFSNNEIHKIMKNYKMTIGKKYNYKINYFIDDSIDFNSKAVYYYINSGNKIIIPEKEVLGEECKENLDQKIFSIASPSFTSDYDYFPKFRQFCQENNLNIVYKKQNFKIAMPSHYFTKKFELINYSIENMKLIQNYIGCTSINLNSFAIMELKSKSKDTFLEYNQSIFQYARSMYCNITIIYYENKIVIYGEPKYRKRLYEIISNYFSELQKEKIIFSLKGKEDNLLLKTIYRKVNQKQIVILVSKNDQGEKQLEFRKKYFDIISKLLFQQKKNKNKNKAQTKSTKCEICLEKFDNENNNTFIKLKLCGHKFCIDCLKMQISNSLQVTSANSIPIKCIKCNTIITNKDIFELIIPNTPEYNFIIDKLITIYMLKNSNENKNTKYFWCPNKKENCNYIYTSKIKDMGETVMTCPNCDCRICLLCNDILDLFTPHNKDCQSKLYAQLSDKNRKWMLKNSKDCPMCHTVYEKNQGCNHMTCTVCRPPTHFCYLCGNILNNSNPLRHFNDKDSKCNNKLWDDESKNNENDINTNNNNENMENNNLDDDNEEENKVYDSDNEGESYSNRNNLKNYNNNNNFSKFKSDGRRDYQNDDLNLTRVMIDRVSQNDSYKNNSHKIYRYSNSKNNDRQRANNFNSYRRGNRNNNIPFNKFYPKRFNK